MKEVIDTLANCGCKVGQTIYVIKYGEEVHEYTVEEIRLPANPYSYSDDTEMKVVFIYNMLYEDCYDCFGVEDIGKTIFFTAEEANKKLEELTVNFKDDGTTCRFCVNRNSPHHQCKNCCRYIDIGGGDWTKKPDLYRKEQPK